MAMGRVLLNSQTFPCMWPIKTQLFTVSFAVRQALAGPKGQAARFARTARGLGILPQLRDYEPGSMRQLQSKQREANLEAIQQRDSQSSHSILQGNSCLIRPGLITASPLHAGLTKQVLQELQQVRISQASFEVAIAFCRIGCFRHSICQAFQHQLKGGQAVIVPHNMLLHGTLQQSAPKVPISKTYDAHLGHHNFKDV